jgi:hypothetical protein
LTCFGVFLLPIFLISAVVVIVCLASSLNAVAAVQLLSTPDDNDNNGSHLLPSQIKSIAYAYFIATHVILPKPHPNQSNIGIAFMH